MVTTTREQLGNGGTRGWLAWLPVAVVAVLLGIIFFDAIAFMMEEWEREEYSHGWLIPAIAGFMVYRKRAELAALSWQPSWAGVAIVLLGMLIMLVGELSTLYTIVQYALLLTLGGVVLTLFGWRSLMILWVPLIYLFFMIPLPGFLYNNLSQELQLVSSQLGVAVIRMFGVSVFLEGNVIDLGVYQLQVVEACSGLRYLFPLMSFGFLCAYLFKAPLWQRALVFLSAIPLTVLMNSFRIGVIGVLVDNFGIDQAEGFLHYFEGWVIFMSCVAFMFGLMWLFSRFGRERKQLADVFNLDFGDDVPEGAAQRPRVAAPLIAVLALLLASAVSLQFLNQREEIVPDRQTFSTFPLSFEQWRGEEESLRPAILRALKLEDYLLANYSKPGVAEPVNLYVAYYSSQRKGASIHSPRACLPGHDWEMGPLTRPRIAGLSENGAPLEVNRVLISKGSSRQLVYYWFEQRGRNLTSEYEVKWYLLWDAIQLNRTDGALIRLTTPLLPGTTVAAADARLREFLELAYPETEGYIPR